MLAWHILGWLTMVSSLGLGAGTGWYLMTVDCSVTRAASLRIPLPVRPSPMIGERSGFSDFVGML
jgi:hypothetical protein